MNSPLISIVIPSFNHDKFIRNAIESVIKQSYTNWELIIVDNYSTDNTDEILCSYDIPNYKVFKIHNGGIIATSRNVGIIGSRGEWIAFLDSDDEWFIDKLQIIVDQIDDSTDILFHDLEIKAVNKSVFNKKYIRGREYEKPVLSSLLINGSKINNSSVMVRREILGKVGNITTDKRMIASEDFNTWLRIAKISDGFKYVPQVLGRYTIHDSGVSRKDMSFSMRYATNEFLQTLTRSQKKTLNSHIRYASCRYIYTNSVKSNITKQLKFCLLYGPFEIKIKSLYMLINLYFKNTLISN